MQNTMYSEKYEPEIFMEAVYNKMSKNTSNAHS